ncbi:MAG TPA: polysaccharide biosynthesis/export family protein [Magnetospirillum sp.]|nr:polysaccharide biosynthesis/export family protein [Magnetospirillum sp.]
MRKGVLAFVLSLAPFGMAGAAPSDSYPLNSGDVLEISVWKETELKREVLVLPDGTISFPLAGIIEARGRTPDAVQKDIEKRLSPFFTKPVVSVSLKAVLGNKVYVIGQVQKPGEFTVPHRLSVMQALSMAGGLTPYASESDILVIRKDDGKDTAIHFDYSAIKHGRALDSNVTLNPGDVVVVPNASLF